MDNTSEILPNRTFLGIELGSTRIKAILIDEGHNTVASGSHSWENRLENDIWTYSLDDVWAGMQDCVADLRRDLAERYGAGLSGVAAVGISAMMHGYLAFDSQDRLLAPFRTWRNTMTEEAASELTELLGFNIPQRWSVAHLYRAILAREEHVKDITFLTTLAGYVHWRLTGEKVLGVGDASGMFPMESETGGYDAAMAKKFDELASGKGFPKRLLDILPRPLYAGEIAGALTEEGARLLDPSGALKAGTPLCPPEGDAGTGMVATNSVAARTGNVSAGTSVFAMIVLEKALSKVYTEIDMVTTPAGRPVAMVHCNSCTSDIDAWVGLFGQVLEAGGCALNKSALYELFYSSALSGDSDCGGLLSFNYYSGEPITQLTEGRPLFVRMPDSRLSLENFTRAMLFSALSTLRLGLDILIEKENVGLDRLFGHGGFFKTKGAGQRIMAAAAKTPVSVMETAGEGGAWGIAVLAAYSQEKSAGEALESYLSEKVFAGMSGTTAEPDASDVAGFERYIKRYCAGLGVERAAADALR